MMQDDDLEGIDPVVSGPSVERDFVEGKEEEEVEGGVNPSDLPLKAHGNQGAVAQMRQTRKTKLTFMAFLTGLEFFLELGAGLYTRSIALMADSFHMLSDLISLFVALWAIRVAERRASDKMSYGWERAEVVAALANSIFLLALCFAIALSAIQRFIMIEEVLYPWVVLIVACIGLVVNLVGLIMLGHDHEHSHGHDHGHGHGHGHHHSHSHDSSVGTTSSDAEDEESGVSRMRGVGVGHSTDDVGIGGGIDMEHQGDIAMSDPQGAREMEGEEEDKTKEDEEKDMNLHGVLLHVMGDALGSVSAIINALVLIFWESEDRFYVDPLARCVFHSSNIPIPHLFLTKIIIFRLLNDIYILILPIKK
jgi:solute carrier family 30 (zinc transporter), member 1